MSRLYYILRWAFKATDTKIPKPFKLATDDDWGDGDADPERELDFVVYFMPKDSPDDPPLVLLAEEELATS